MVHTTRQKFVSQSIIQSLQMHLKISLSQVIVVRLVRQPVGLCAIHLPTAKSKQKEGAWRKPFFLSIVIRINRR